MKSIRINVTAVLVFSLSLFTGCNQYLELESLEKVSAEQLSTSEKGLRTLLANLYNSIPMEDFNYRPDAGFNRRGWGNGVNEITMTSMFTDESVKSDGGGATYPGSYNYFADAFTRNRDINVFFETIESAKSSGVIDESTYSRLASEAHFVRAYTYYALVIRFGGVPIIDKLLDNEYVAGSANEALFVPRNTEKETWDFILKECDLAVAGLPETVSGDDLYRASKYAAYGLKSRAALHAASVAKYWDLAPLTGEAVNQKLVGGMTLADANTYYQQCIDASAAIIASQKYSLVGENPANAEDAATNYQYLFLNQPNSEVIFSRAYLDGTTVANQGHDYDIRYSPSQAHPGFHKWGRFSPTLDIVDLYEDYTDDGTGKSAKIVTRTDGNENYYTADPQYLDINIPFKKYNDLYEPFAGKDARLLASVIVPGGVYKGIKIVLQGGLIGKDGSVIAYASGSEVGKDGKTYYTYGAESSGGYSGFFGMGRSDDANFSCSGFTIRKYLAENKSIPGVERSSYTSWIDMRLAEIYLNYAEAVAESGLGDATAAKNYINALRKRAAHRDEIPLTLDNVLKERRIELAFEGKRIWDMMRRREYHTFFTSGKRHALVPMIDLRENDPKFIFARVNLYYDEMAGGRTVNPINYYCSIPSTATSLLVQNPGF